MIFAHLMGVPVEESALALAPAGAAILSGAAVIARSKLAQIVGWLRRRSAVPGHAEGHIPTKWNHLP
jgi:hypothetical protein